MHNMFRLVTEETETPMATEEKTLVVAAVEPGSFVQNAKTKTPMLVTATLNLELGDKVVGVVYMDSYVFKWIGAQTEVCRP